MKTVLSLGCFVLISLACSGQHSFSPSFAPPVYNPARYPGYGSRPSATAFEATSIKQLYTIVYQDSTVSMLRAEIGDYKGRTFLMIDEPGVAKSIQPRDTKSLIVGTLEKPRHVGIATDSCWLFKISKATISLYSLLPTTDRRFVIAVQKGDDAPIVPLTKENLLEMIEEGHAARKSITKGKLFEAIKVYNKGR